MKKIGYMFLIVCVSCMITACKSAVNQAIDEKKEESSILEQNMRTALTERQREILESQGLNADLLERDGLDHMQERLLACAETALDYMDDKYGDKFVMISGKLKSVLNSNDIIRVCLQSDTAEEQIISVYLEKNGEDVICTDDYLPVLKQQEYQTYIQEKAESVYGTCIAYVEFGGRYDKTYTTEISIEEIANRRESEGEGMYGTGRILVFSTGEDEEAFKEKNKQFMRLMNDNHIDMIVTVYAMTEESTMNMTYEEAFAITQASPECRWREVVTVG